MGVEQETVKEIFVEALGKESLADRIAFLDEVCGSDVELRAAVEDFLDSHEKMGEFLKAAATGVIGDPSTPLENLPKTEKPLFLWGKQSPFL